MTLLEAASKAGRTPRAQEHEFPPDCACNVCKLPIGATEPRWRCAEHSCDDVHLCGACSAAPRGGHASCPACGARPAQMYADQASAFVLRARVFRESFVARRGADERGAAALVAPRVMLDRAFRAYGGRPLLGEPGGGDDAGDGIGGPPSSLLGEPGGGDEGDGSGGAPSSSVASVRWWSYEACGGAARGLARELRGHCRGGDGSGDAGATSRDAVVVLCASNRREARASLSSVGASGETRAPDDLRRRSLSVRGTRASRPLFFSTRTSVLVRIRLRIVSSTTLSRRAARAGSSPTGPARWPRCRAS